MPASLAFCPRLLLQDMWIRKLLTQQADNGFVLVGKHCDGHQNLMQTVVDCISCIDIIVPNAVGIGLSLIHI